MALAGQTSRIDLAVLEEVAIMPVFASHLMIACGLTDVESRLTVEELPLLGGGDVFQLRTVYHLPENCPF
jgi:hypothetical protein